ncbi:MAG TPA: NAD-dependent epimerase/dehydratase family protein [Dermatophilaceae bacterium]|nr:NAD-dependent epimerase/dehydratase family protein [Dermatophilaceae bacterium]
MHYALDGATGFVGGAVARLLRSRGHRVSALVRDPAGAAGLDGVRLVVGDLDDRAALADLLDGVDGFFHVAGWYGLGGDRKAAVAANVVGTRNAIQAAVAAGVPRVVHTSTLAVNSDTGGQVVDETYRFTGSHLSVYDETKAQAHQVAHDLAAEGAPVVTVMPGMVYGPGDTSATGTMIRRVVDGRRPVVPAGGGLCWGHVDDIAAGHLAAMERGRDREDYMLAGPRLALADGLRLVAELAGTSGPVVLPRQVVAGAARAAGLLGRVLPLPATYGQSALRSALATYLGSAAKAQAELGWTVRPVREGLQQVVDAQRRGR